MACDRSIFDLMTPYLLALFILPLSPENGQAQMDVQTLTGIITQTGHLETDTGRIYQLVGDKAEEIKTQIGKKIQITGKIFCAQEEEVLEPENYKILQEIRSD